MGHKILLADDSITIQKVIELTFSDEDFELHTVGNGQKAIDEIRSVMPDVVLCDIIMPEKNGYEVCEFIKSSPDLRHIPVLLLTGAFEPFDQERAKAAGCEGFLAKPFEPQTLISRVKELLVSAPVSAPAAAPPAPPVVPPAPPAPATIETDSDLEDAFAVEAGERELTMGPADHTVLLGADESESLEGGAGVSEDDIWGEVAREAPADEDDSATVFMAAPPPAVVSSDGEEPSANELERSDPDSTWRLPNEETIEAEAADEGLSGFQEFADPPAPQETPDELTFEPAFEDESSHTESEETSEFEPVSVDDYTEFEPVLEPPSQEQETRPVASAEPKVPPPSPAAKPPSAPTPPPPAREPIEEAPVSGRDGVDEALIERVAQRVVDRLSAKVIQEIAWEVVPELAEGLIRKEIEVLKAKIPK
ncbi:MAG TPA: response regulator [Vicinamibacteria bacterium]|nr:response regulator [Vicinamibacteria bacterium]